MIEKFTVRDLRKTLLNTARDLKSENHAYDHQSPTWTFGQLDAFGSGQRLSGKTRRRTGLATARNGPASDVSGHDRPAALRAPGALQNEPAPALLRPVRSAVRGTGGRPLELASLCRAGLAGSGAR